MLDSDVLSQLMITRLDALFQAAHKGPLPLAGSEDRELLFKAIAEAVVSHVKDSAVVEGDVTGVGVISNGVIT
jgi:hypothetical protein